MAFPAGVSNIQLKTLTISILDILLKPPQPLMGLFLKYFPTVISRRHDANFRFGLSFKQLESLQTILINIYLISVWRMEERFFENTREKNIKQWKTVTCNTWLLLLSVSCRRWNAIIEVELCEENLLNKQVGTWRWNIPTWFTSPISSDHLMCNTWSSTCVRQMDHFKLF